MLRNERSTTHRFSTAEVKVQGPAKASAAFDWKRHGPMAIAATGLAAMVVLIVFAFWMRPRSEPGADNKGTDDQPTRSTNPPNADRGFARFDWVGGRVFDGKSNYIVAPLMNHTLPNAVTIEVALVPIQQSSPANVVTFSGRRCLVLFISNSRWGLAYFDGNQSKLVVSQKYVAYAKPNIVCGKLEDGSLSLYVNGELQAVEPIEYPMQPGPPNLYIGGIPDGVIPSEQGTRYFEGTIFCVRICVGANLVPARSIEGLGEKSHGLFALYTLREDAGNVASDLSVNALHGMLKP